MSDAILTDLLGLVRFAVDPEPHIKLDKDICGQCRDRVCIRVCPTRCFTAEGGEMMFSHQNCLECGACRISCRNGALDWNHPKGGYGVCFRY
jgi:ferredoxin like protein